MHVLVQVDAVRVRSLAAIAGYSANDPSNPFNTAVESFQDLVRSKIIILQIALRADLAFMTETLTY